MKSTQWKHRGGRGVVIALLLVTCIGTALGGTAAAQSATRSQAALIRPASNPPDNNYSSFDYFTTGTVRAGGCTAMAIATVHYHVPPTMLRSYGTVQCKGDGMLTCVTVRDQDWEVPSLRHVDVNCVNPVDHGLHFTTMTNSACHIGHRYEVSLSIFVFDNYDPADNGHVVHKSISDILCVDWHHR